MWLLVGLGNPGSSYAQHRHNVGFMAIDAIAHELGCGVWKSKFQGKLTEGRFGAEKLLCLKPETYMNLSGQAVAEAVNFHKIPLEKVIVFHDDLDLTPGKIRLKRGGGHGGHNGLRSIDAHLGQDYQRVRIGIGHPGSKELVHSYVLSDFMSADKLWLTPLLPLLAKHLPLLLKGDEAGYMNKIALEMKPVTKPIEKESAS